MNEREIIECIQQGGGAKEGYGLLRGIGDDCAVIKKDERSSWLVTMDTLSEGVHFDVGWHPPEKLTIKSVAVNVSDIAAMGGKPLFLFLSLGLPKGFDSSWVKKFSQGIGDACIKNNCFLAGGDTVRCREDITITITAIGEVPIDQVVYRSGALPGDTVWVSGTLGMAAAGLELCRNNCDSLPQHLIPLVEAHLTPEPRTHLGRLLAGNKIVHSLMDLSDGLATDLLHLCKESGVGALIHAIKLPIDPGVREVSETFKKDPLDLVLRGGEDYELLFTASPESAEKIKTCAEQAGVSVTPVGTIVDEPGVRLNVLSSTGKGQKEIEIGYEGFDHFSER